MSHNCHKKAHILNNKIQHLLQRTIQYFLDHHQQAYLTGGSLRNLMLHEPSLDWDIVTTGDAPKLARQLADQLGGYYTHMHEKASRISIKHQQQDIIIDISPLKGHNLEDDLRARDFTINAMAAPLTDIVHHLETGDPLQLIDPLNGLADIQARQLRAVDNDIFRHDPLRMLRAVRLKARYQLSIDPWTQELIRRDAPLLPSVAAERIHDELYAILQPNGATEQLHFLDTLDLLTVIIPEFIPARGMPQPRPHYWDVLEHSLQAVAALELLAIVLAHGEPTSFPAESQLIVPPESEDLAEIRTLLHEAEQQGIFQFAALTAPRMKLAALLHDIGKPATYTTDEDGSIHFYGHPQVGVPLAQQIMKRLSASTQDRRLVQLVVNHHMRPGNLGQNDEPVTMRATRRYFVDLGPTGILIALFSLADHIATHGPQPSHTWERHLAVVRLLLTRYIRERQSILPPQLISPEELMRKLNLEPGPLIGQLLERIAEAQAEGQIHSKEEALWLAQEKLNQEM
jgi:poly(A) polymerase